MRSWLSQCALPGADKENILDRALVLCLTGEGPKYLGADMVKDSGLYRTVGYVWYDRDFARIFFGEMIRANGKAKAIARTCGDVLCTALKAMGGLLLRLSKTGTRTKQSP